MPVVKRPSRATVMPLKGSLRHKELRLDAEALAALHLAAAHIRGAHQLRPTLSAITRRALVTYLHRIESMSRPDIKLEANHVLIASKSSRTVDAEALERSLAGLEVLEGSNPLPSLAAVLQGRSEPSSAAETEAKVVAMLKAMQPRRFKNLEHL